MCMVCLKLKRTATKKILIDRIVNCPVDFFVKLIIRSCLEAVIDAIVLEANYFFFLKLCVFRCLANTGYRDLAERYVESSETF